MPVVDANVWRERLAHAQSVYEHEVPIWNALEDAVDGKYPDVITPSAPFLFSGTDLEGWLRTGNQLDVNLLGAARDHYQGISYDRFPTFRFSRDPSMDKEAVLAAEKLVERLAMDGGLIPECRRAMDASLCRGQFIVWTQASEVGVSEAEMVASTTPPGAWVEAARTGAWDGKIPLGTDLNGVVVACETVLRDPVVSLTLQERERLAIMALLEKAQKMALREREGPHSLKLPSKITWEATPYGPWCSVDSSVTDYRRISWAQRTHVFNQDEFMRSPRFSEKAKAEVVPLPLSPKGGGPPTGPLAAQRADSKHILDHYGRIVVREIWDKTAWKRHYLVDGYADFAEKDSRYPYFDYWGRPLFKDFFPVEWRTPRTRMRDCAGKLLGRPVLEDGWSTQIEYIKTISAYVTACKATKRILIAGKGVSQASIDAFQNADDMACIRPTDDHQPLADGDFTKQVSVLPQPPAPIEYLNAAQIVKGDFASMVKIAPAALFGKSTDPTASQEAMSQAGAATVQGDFVRTCEDGTAAAAYKGLLLFLAFANPQELEAYLGADALLPRSSVTGKPVKEADIAAGIVPDMPSIAAALKSLNLSGSRLSCRFAAGTEQEDLMYIKNQQDFLALNNTIRDGAMLPYMDPRPLLQRLAKSMDIDFVPYEPSPAEKQMALAAATQPQGEGGGEEGGDAPPKPGSGADSRKAGGGRGAPNVPGRQERNRQPDVPAGATGRTIRQANSRA